MRLGERPVVSFRRGVDRSLPDSASPADAAQLIINGWVNDDGSIERVFSPSFAPASETGSGEPYLGVAAVSFDGDEHWLRFRDTSINWTKASEGHGTFHNTAYTGTAEADQFFDHTTFRQANTDYVIFANGDDVHSFDGTTLATVANAPTGTKYLATFHDRVWAAGHDGSALAASKIADFSTWSAPDGLALPVQTHNSEDIVGLYPLGSILLVFKANSVGYVDGFGNSDVIVAAGGSGVTQSTGCISFRTIVPVGDGVAWLSRRGIEYVQPGGAIQLVSEPITDVIQNLAWPVIEANPGLACGVYYPARRAAIWALPTAFAGNDLFVVWRPGTATQPASWSFISHTILPLIGSGSPRYVFQTDADGYNTIQPVNVFDVEFSNALDPWESLTGTDPEGYTEIVDPQAPGGAYLQTSFDGYLEFQDLVGAPIFAKGLMLARVGSALRPIVMTTHGGLIEIDDPRNATMSTVFDSRNVPFQVVTRPEMFGRPTRKKRARYVRVSGQMLSDDLDTIGGTDPLEPVVHVRLVTDRNEKTDHEVTWNATAAPIFKTFKVSGRGIVHQVDIRTKKRFKLTGVALAAEELQEEP